MSKLFLTLILCLNFLWTADAFAQQALRIGIIGDSIAGVGDHAVYGMWAKKNEMVFYPEFLQGIAETDPRFQVLAVDAHAGSKATSGPERVSAMLAKYDIDLLIFQLGANDLLGLGTVHSASEAIIKSIEIARKKKIKVLLIGIQSVRYRQGRQFDMAAKEFEGRKNFYYLPNFFEDLREADFYNLLGVPHPSKEAQELLATGLYEFLDDHYDSMTRRWRRKRKKSE
ncbi:MAG: hypothetical protein KDD52_02965 [Bdellovibrionales bacterium]|nr:hypothetical protein [Bdellovibrionales bacterium]